MRAPILFGFALVLLAGSLAAQEGGNKLQSGIKVGDVLPGPFDAFTINGKVAKGRQHCLVCDFGLDPVVMVFAREPEAGKDGTLSALLSKLDELVGRYADKSSLASCAIFLSPDGQSSATNPTEQDPRKLVEEARAREALVKRLEERAEKLKNVVVAFMPAEGPKDYHINPKAEVTVLFYIKHKVLANFAFGEGAMTSGDGDAIVKTVEGSLSKKQAVKR